MSDKSTTDEEANELRSKYDAAEDEVRAEAWPNLGECTL